MINHRANAESNIGKAAASLNEIGTGQVNAQEVASRSARATAIATLAVAQALLDIGDTLRAIQNQEQP